MMSKLVYFHTQKNNGEIFWELFYRLFNANKENKKSREESTASFQTLNR